jgi:hypothetical protein
VRCMQSLAETTRPHEFPEVVRERFWEAAGDALSAAEGPRDELKDRMELAVWVRQHVSDAVHTGDIDGLASAVRQRLRRELGGDPRPWDAQ